MNFPRLSLLRLLRSTPSYLSPTSSLHSAFTSPFTSSSDGYTRPVTIDDYESSPSPSPLARTPFLGDLAPHVAPPLPPLHVPLSASTSCTVYQVATGRGVAGVSIIRISGPLSLYAALTLTRRVTPPSPRQATSCALFHPVTHHLLDSPVLLLYFKQPQSFTGEDVVELHCHGNPQVVAAIMRALASVSQLAFNQCANADTTISTTWMREAEAGEFTRRAFANGKLDLTKVEALADLLCAQTDAQHKQAVHQLDGALSRLYDSWRHELVGLLAHVEAVLDFGEDEPDVSAHDIVHNVLPRVARLKELLMKHVNDAHRGELTREGVEVCIVGAVNAGKSTLLNTLARRDVAIVSAYAGTTRDLIECAINLRGHAVRLIDTAGLRECVDEVEQEGVRRARQRASKAQMCVVAVESSRVWEQSDTEWQANGLLELINDNSILLLTKVDEVAQIADASQFQSNDHQILHNASQTQRLAAQQAHTQKLEEAARSSIFRARERLLVTPAAIVAISCREHFGIDTLTDALTTNVKKLLALDHADDADSTPVITRARHRSHIVDCIDSLDSAANLLQANDLVLTSEALRACVTSLGRVVGRIDVEDVLDVIFADFCIGK